MRVSKTADEVATSYLQDQGSSLPRVLVETKGGQETLYVWGLGLLTQVNSDGTRRYIKPIPWAPGWSPMTQAIPCRPTPTMRCILLSRVIP